MTEQLRVFDIPEAAPNRESPFSVTVGGMPLGLMTENNEWNKPVSFGIFEFNDGCNAEIIITPDFSFNSVRVFPENEVSPYVIDGRVGFTLRRPVNALSVVFDSDWQGSVLHIFTNPVDSDRPRESSGDLIYFPSGYYDLTDNGGSGELILQSGQILYLDGGAVIDGTVSAYDAENIHIAGSGIIMKSDEAASRSNAQSINLLTSRCKNVRVDGVICHAHRMHNWTVHFWHSSDIAVNRLKIVSPVYASTDGIDISNSSRVTVTDTFIRACDDCVALKGLCDDTMKPCECPPIEDISFLHCVMWNDCNNCMGLGAETRASVYRNISFSDIEVLYSYDDRDHHLELDERSVMTICCLHGTYFENISWDNIKVHMCQRLICLTFRDSFWFGSIQGDQSTPGGIKNVAFRNITVEALDPASPISGKTLIEPLADKPIEGVSIDHCYLPLLII